MVASNWLMRIGQAGDFDTLAENARSTRADTLVGAGPEARRSYATSSRLRVGLSSFFER